MRKSPEPRGTTNGRSEEVAALLTAARAVLENRAFTDAARAILAACKAILGADAGFVAVSSPGGKGLEVACLDPGSLGLNSAAGLPAPLRRLCARASKARPGRHRQDLAKGAPQAPPGDDHVALESALVAPVVIAGDVAGLVGLINKPGGFSAADSRLAEVFAEMAAVAMLNSRTVNGLEKNRNALEARGARGRHPSAPGRGEVQDAGREPARRRRALRLGSAPPLRQPCGPARHRPPVAGLRGQDEPGAGDVVRADRGVGRSPAEGLRDRTARETRVRLSGAGWDAALRLPARSGARARGRHIVSAERCPGRDRPVARVRGRAARPDHRRRAARGDRGAHPQPRPRDRAGDPARPPATDGPFRPRQRHAPRGGVAGLRPGRLRRRPRRSPDARGAIGVRSDRPPDRPRHPDDRRRGSDSRRPRPPRLEPPNGSLVRGELDGGPAVRARRRGRVVLALQARGRLLQRRAREAGRGDVVPGLGGRRERDSLRADAGIDGADEVAVTPPRRSCRKASGATLPGSFTTRRVRP